MFRVLHHGFADMSGLPGLWGRGGPEVLSADVPLSCQLRCGA